MPCAEAWWNQADLMAAPGRPPSSFLDPGLTTTADSVVILHLKRDLLIPTKLSEGGEKNEGYDEGLVTNTRFGSFPHSTLVGLPWGSQVRASAVDTGSRGRRGPRAGDKVGTKRKRDESVANGSGSGSGSVKEDEAETEDAVLLKAAVTAASGFAHVLPLTPEAWTAALPHRTQVVYTPDYSYILHRLRVRPGSVLIEAGAGSGSFTHAAARAVFNGFPTTVPPPKGSTSTVSSFARSGRVFSYEFHESRIAKLRSEIASHGLGQIVHITHRDVCRDGFRLDETDVSHPASGQADAIFLDLPAPWLALRHLTRHLVSNVVEEPSASTDTEVPEPRSPSDGDAATDRTACASPLNPHQTVHICTFSPCIEQIQRTVTVLQQLGWVDIEMVEIGQKRIEVRRERVGLQEAHQRGVHVGAATVDEAVARLKEVEGRFKAFHAEAKAGRVRATDTPALPALPATEVVEERKLYKEGRLIHRAEPELKGHTSYLLFAVLPQEWSEEEEVEAGQQWPLVANYAPAEHKMDMSNRQLKRAAKARTKAIEVEAPPQLPSPS
ncbi:MAG: tRNA (adenine-N(1)-)-methyltransferase catalytic subunit trm61 [Thelocarpon superellum]|nr:MAG: tRNA (adenine-N(1)-)-methyltransferase catalytic subunit trm61 [Thelocarpon superellum]